MGVCGSLIAERMLSLTQSRFLRLLRASSAGAVPGVFSLMGAVRMLEASSYTAQRNMRESDENHCCAFIPQEEHAHKPGPLSPPVCVCVRMCDCACNILVICVRAQVQKRLTV